MGEQAGEGSRRTREAKRSGIIAGWWISRTCPGKMQFHGFVGRLRLYIFPAYR